jgi:gluconokinase
MVVILFGVSGVGKTTIGKLLAHELNWKFYDADDFHPEANVRKMTNGIPLTDEDRTPWLDTLRNLIEKCLAESESAVLACSALRDSYRNYLKVNDDVKLIHLSGSYEQIQERLAKRKDHYMNPNLLKSQFVTLEEPAKDIVAVDITPAPEAIVEAIRKLLNI